MWEDFFWKNVKNVFRVIFFFAIQDWGWKFVQVAAILKTKARIRRNT